MSEKPKSITLATIANGSVEERFAVELDNVLRNIEDENTPAKGKRTITIQFVITPDEDRQIGEVQIGITTKLAGMRGLRRQWYFGRHAGAPIAVENHVEQDLFDSDPGPKLVEKE